MVDSNTPLPNWDVPEGDFAFPEGWYICAFGAIKAIYPEDNPSIPDAVLHDIWVLKYRGTESKPEDVARIRIHDGRVTMNTKGTHLSERYPHPTKMPKMAWRARSFFAPFDCITEITLPSFDAEGKPEKKKVVDWSKVQMAYGRLFRMRLAYSKAKEGNKSYRNIDYDSVEPLSEVITAGDMKIIEAQWDMMKKQEESTSGGSGAPPVKADDLPF